MKLLRCNANRTPSTLQHFNISTLQYFNISIFQHFQHFNAEGIESAYRSSSSSCWLWGANMGSPFCQKKLPPRPFLLCARYEGKTPEFPRGSRSQERAKIAPIRLQHASKTPQDISSIPMQVMIAAVSLRFSVSHPILISPPRHTNSKTRWQF